MTLPAPTPPKKMCPSAVKVFWYLSLATTLLGTLYFTVQEGSFIECLVILALVFPVVQVVCVVITLIYLEMSSGQDKSFQLRQIGKIMWGLLVGTAIGLIPTILVFMLLVKGF